MGKYCYRCGKTKSKHDFDQGSGKCKECKKEIRELKKLNYDAVICNAIAEKFNDHVSPEDLKKVNKKRVVAYARGLSMIYRNKVMKQSQAVAAGYYDKDHSTLIAARKTANNMKDTDPVYREALAQIELQLNVKLL